MRYDVRGLKVHLDLEGHRELNAVKIALDVLEQFSRLIEEVIHSKFQHVSKLISGAASNILAEHGERIEREIRKLLDDKEDVFRHDFKFNIATTISNGYADAEVLRSTLTVCPTLSMKAFNFELAYELYEAELTISLEATGGEVIAFDGGLTLTKPNGGEGGGR